MNAREYHSPTCARCGYIRQAAGAKSPLCNDCRLVLSDEERALWTGKVPA